MKEEKLYIFVIFYAVCIAVLVSLSSYFTLVSKERVECEKHK